MKNNIRQINTEIFINKFLNLNMLDTERHFIKGEDYDDLAICIPFVKFTKDLPHLNEFILITLKIINSRVNKDLYFRFFNKKILIT